MIILRLDRVMADRKISLNELANRVGIANVNLSKIKTGKISAIRFSTLEAICRHWTASPEIFSNIGRNRPDSEPRKVILPPFGRYRDLLNAVREEKRMKESLAGAGRS